MTSTLEFTALQGKILIPFVAPPNAGKGTQTQILSENYPLVTFDMGAAFRAIMKEGADPELKLELEKFINAGRLVPVEIVAEVFKRNFEALAGRCTEAKGFILDGFPRSTEQALVLDQLCEEWRARLAAVIYLRVSTETIEKRATGRRFCSADPKHVYNINTPALAPKRYKVDEQGLIFKDQKSRDVWLCDKDQAELIIRPDDEPEKVKIRLEEYSKDTEPLLSHFRKLNLLIEVDGESAPQEVTRALDVHINSLLTQ